MIELEEKKANNKKTIMIIIGIILMLGIIITSFAYFSARYGTTEQEITTENLDIVYVDSENINITIIYPLIDEEVNSKATISGKGSVALEDNKQSVDVTVRAENGEVRVTATLNVHVKELK